MVHYLMLDATGFITRMSVNNPHPSSPSAASGGYQGTGQMGLPEILQMCCLGKRSGQMTFSSGEAYGYIYMQHGQVIHSIYNQLEGEEAIYAMLQLPQGTFSFDEAILPHKRTI